MDSVKEELNKEIKSDFTALSKVPAVHNLKEQGFSESETKRYQHYRPNIAVVMGNGPSAKLVDFEILSAGHIASVGMNAAYRYWDQIDFRPTYYICMDEVVILSHADRIFELINEGRIQKFFLRDKIKEKYPTLADNERILWYDDVIKDKHKLFNTFYVTTGSWAIRWMAYENMKTLVLVGIDTNYVELIQEASRIGNERDIRLVINKTPEFNPNYFIDNYQQTGDLYNIPNDPIKKNEGELVHIEALRHAKDDITKNGYDLKIIDSSPLSGHAIFEKREFYATISEFQFAIVTSFYVAAPADELENNLRVLIKNALNPFVGMVLILLEGDSKQLESKVNSDLMNQVWQLEAKHRIKFQIVSTRPNYLDIFEAGRASGWDQYAVINADVYLSPDLSSIILNDIARNNNIGLLFAVTRWNRTPSGLFLQTCIPSPPWSEISYEKMLFQDRNYLSFDFYFINSATALPAKLADIQIGTFGCDTAIAGSFRINGIALTNPCLRYISEHEDNKIREYNKQLGKSQQIHSTDVVKNALLGRYKNRPLILESLQNLKTLRTTVANIGRFLIIHDNWFKLFRILGTSPWSVESCFIPVKFTKISVDANKLEEIAEELLKKVVSAISKHEFIEIEISGGKMSKDHYLNLFFNSHPYLEQVRLLLYPYDWHSVIHLDHATNAEKRIYSDVLFVLKDILSLSGKEPVKAQNKIDEAILISDSKSDESTINLLSNVISYDGNELKIEESSYKNTPYFFRGTTVFGNVIEQQHGYIINPNYDDNWIACVFDGLIEPNDIIQAKVFLSVSANSNIFFMLCRDGSTTFESNSAIKLLEKGTHEVEITHQFNYIHKGFRIQIGVKDNVVDISDIGSEVLIIKADKKIEITTRAVSSVKNTSIPEQHKIVFKNEKNLINKSKSALKKFWRFLQRDS